MIPGNGMRERLQEPRPDWDLLSAIAVNWETCAIGERYDKFPDVILMDWEHGPLDNILRDLGIAFYDAVSTHDKDRALSLLSAIDRRVDYMRTITP